MALSKRNRDKQLKKAQQALPSARVTELVIGRSGANPVLVGWIIGGLFIALGVALYLATGAFVMPGALVFLLIQAYASPARAIVVADRGVALVKRSALSGNITTVLAMAPFEGVRPVSIHGSRVEVAFLHERVWLTKSEDHKLRTAIEVVNRAGPAAAYLPPSLV